jgi:hypothetical protein
VDTGSREENASKQQALAVPHQGWKRSRATVCKNPQWFQRIGLARGAVRKCRLDQAAITVLEFPIIKGRLS